MTAQGLVRVVMQADTRQLRAALSGAVVDSRRADQATRASAAAAERQKVVSTRNAERERVRAVATGAREKTRIEERAAREQASIARRLAADQQRLERQRSREAQTSARSRERAMRGDMRAARTMALGVAGGVTAAALTALTGALEAVSTRLQTVASAVAARAGTMDVGQRTANAQDFELQMARSSGEFFQGQDPAQMAESMHALQAEVLGVAAASAQSPTQLLGVLAMMQSEFSQFDVGRANLEAIANEATRTGAEMEGLARFVGVVNHQLGATAPTATRLFDIMAEQGLQGALTPEQLSTDFGGMFGQFTQMSGLQGEDAVRQFGAMANALKTKDMSSAETATLMQNFFTALGNGPTRDALLEATGGHAVGTGAARHVEGGTSALRPDGTIDFSTLVHDMSQVEGIGTSDVVFHDSQARQAAGQLVALDRRDRAGEAGVVTMDELQAVDAAHGASLRSRNLATVEGTTAMASRRLAVGGEVEGIQSMDRRVHGDLGAQAMNAFDAAVVSTDSQALQGILGWLPAQGLQRAATAASGSMSAEQRQFYSARAENAGFGDPEAMLVQALLRLGDETTRLQGAASGRGAPPTKIADGSRVELGASTVAALAAAVRTPTAPTDGRTPSEPRR